LIQRGYQSGVFRFFHLPSVYVTFYLEHRIGHCPVIYSHAHKMHHYLHDTTSFDAHIYGTGMNEEFFWILAESLPCLASGGLLFPYFLNWAVLRTSWQNKSSHTRTEGSHESYCDEANFHADHHSHHRANFGLSGNPLLDFYFGTQAATSRLANGRAWSVREDADGKSVILQVTPLKALHPGDVTRGAGSTTDNLASPVDVGREAISLATLGKLAEPSGQCWLVVHGAVLDLSNFVGLHPGGDAVLEQYSGMDATVAFDEVGHSGKAQRWARKFVVGRLEGSKIAGTFS